MRHYMEVWDDYVGAVSSGLLDVAITDKAAAAMTPTDGFRRWLELTADVHARGRHLFFIGNGGSAGIASHIAADACKNGSLRARAFNDSALLTATANDLAFNQVFALPLIRFADAGDMLISISSSGRSPNIVTALERAQELGLRIVTLSGMDADNPSRTFGDVNFYVPKDR